RHQSRSFLSLWCNACRLSFWLMEFGMAKTDQPHLRIVGEAPGELLVPRRYAQSTSGRSSSQRTAPPLSRSKAMTSDSPKRPPVESFFLMYPSVVPHRAAKESCSAGFNDDRNARSDERRSLLAMGPYSLPMGNLVSNRPGFLGNL